MMYARVLKVEAGARVELQVNVIMDCIEGEDFKQVVTKPLASMPCGAPGQAFVAFEKSEGECSTGKFSNTLRFIVKEVSTASIAYFQRRDK